MIASRALTGNDLRIEDVWEVAVHRAPVQLADEARAQMQAARALVEHASEHTYGVNTGFGRFVSEDIPAGQVDELQLRLLRSHACGVGEPYPADVVRAAMLLRANALAKGYSGARVETVELLVECLNRGVLPRVPSRGSVGASGDLAPLAHLALPLVGEGHAWFEGALLDGAAALGAAGLEPTVLRAKEGLSLINGTQFMTAMGALALVRAWRLARVADLACALSLESLQGSRTSFHPAIHRVRPLQGQVDSAANIHLLLDGSAIIESHRWCDKVQDAYSLRCAPQVHGASRDLIDFAGSRCEAIDFLQEHYVGPCVFHHVRDALEVVHSIGVLAGVHVEDENPDRGDRVSKQELATTGHAQKQRKKQEAMPLDDCHLFLRSGWPRRSCRRSRSW